MKKLLFLCTFITMVINVQGQNDWCGFKADDSFLNGVTTTANQNVTLEYFTDQPPLVLKVHFYDVRPDQLPQEHPFLTEIEALNAVAELNKNFNSFKIFFKFDGLDYFVTDDFYNIDTEQEQDDFEDFLFTNFTNNYFVEGAVNIYFVHNIFDFQAAYFGVFNDAPYFGTIVSGFNFIDNADYSYVLTHEVGHNFGLEHTFYCRELPVEGDPLLCENVTRDPSAVDEDGNSIYNADTEGDKIIDTYATPQDYIKTDCEYDDDKEDSTGTPYSNHPPQAKNFMAYGGCQEEFTAGQVAKMRWYIDLVDGIPNVTAIIKNDISILYEPYKGEYFLAGSLPVDEDGHLNPPLFQYGFDYVFYDTSQADIYNQPSDYGNTSFWYGQAIQSYDIDYNTPIEHINHTAFKTLQVDTNYPRMCYNNYNRAPTGGTLIKFLDGVPNTNVTVTTQDSLQINNTNFFQDLEPGLYNIQKSYNDGTTDENLILKENN